MRCRTLSAWMLAPVLLLPACSEREPAEAEAPAVAAPGEPGRFPTPFSAEQIRDAMPPGLVLELRRVAGDSRTLERWTVLSADAEGTEIEFATLDPAGAVIGEPRVSRSGWVELRDHASFPAAHTSREEVVRDTALGKLDGWLYTVEDPEAGTVSRFFFARSLPGAPVEMRVTRGEEIVAEMTQVSRNRP